MSVNVNGGLASVVLVVSVILPGYFALWLSRMDKDIPATWLILRSASLGLIINAVAVGSLALYGGDLPPHFEKLVGGVTEALTNPASLPMDAVGSLIVILAAYLLLVYWIALTVGLAWRWGIARDVSSWLAWLGAAAERAAFAAYRSICQRSKTFADDNARGKRREV